MQPATTVIDVRTISPRDRHPLIFATFDRLGPDEGLEVVADHDPKPLSYQFEAERPGQVAWRYLEAGPDVWRVHIGRRGEAPAESAVTLDTTVNDLLRLAPEAGGLLNDLGVDTCCGGSNTLREAAVDAGMDPQALLAQARTAASG
jgi:regulator of cell morphogenesis and NO signaling